MKMNEMMKKAEKRNTRAFVIINETHSLLPEQEQLLREQYDDWSVLSVPAAGWNIREMKKQIKKLTSKEIRGDKRYLDVVFVSPIPYMIRELTRCELWTVNDYAEDTGLRVRIFHNDRREKKELPNGKIIQVVAREGWQLV